MGWYSVELFTFQVCEFCGVSTCNKNYHFYAHHLMIS